MSEYLPVVIMFLIAVIFACVFVLVSYLLGPKKKSIVKQSPYECGVPPTGDSRKRFSAKFYLVAILFIVFDIEIVFLYPWAVNYKGMIEKGHGLYMLGVMGFFFFMLVLGLVYEWRKGVMDWGAKERRNEDAKTRRHDGAHA